ncbi:hypothetical protein LGK95_13280 [Clostridium algoriphilum]|uniref:hypothetical protein n=1 Tax=Clostridium algoriphilum TaxID=198347 RepID=UPI001CF4F52D|nr:hypothetical protein [Clostridium algoriphilum]MCB2294482.1 hypothetical protein [Clostridium algoriphilum]
MLEQIDKDSANNYNIPFLIYSFEEEGKISSIIVNGNGKSMRDTRENRQLKSAAKPMVGQSSK